MTFKELLEKVAIQNASDLHISVGLPPMMRKNGHLMPVVNTEMMPEHSEAFAKELMNKRQWESFMKTGEHDFSFSTDKCRFRVNVFRQKQNISIALRLLSSTIPPLATLGLPEIISDLCGCPRGLILVTGPTGSGKSTTLASMIDVINTTRDAHIITLEDPIEYVHHHGKSIVNQREISSDTLSYSNALRAALRQDVDILLIGEMRDLETISIALTAAETGHLVLSTLHTIGAAKTIDRIIDVFPPYQQQQIRMQVSMTLVGVISQQLIPTADGNGRAVAVETMLATSAIKNLIRENKTPQIMNTIQTSYNLGMRSMDNSIAALYKNGTISYESAIAFATDNKQITKLMY